MLIRAALLLVPALVVLAAGAPEVRYHLTARPWKPLAIERSSYLDVVEGVCRFSIRHQDASGAIIDPFLKREHQYATPYFAYAAGSLVSSGRAMDILPHGIAAMEHSSARFASGRKSIPDEHGEFFIPVLTEALELYKPFVTAEVYRKWCERMKTPVREVVRGGVNNWETYPMKGEWLRARAGLVSREDAVAFIEQAWSKRQRERIYNPFGLYHDRSSDPDTLSVEAVGRGNLLALTHLGYDGPSSEEIAGLVETGARTSLLLQDPSGQTPANGRTDDHVWVDVGYQLAFEVMAQRAWSRGDRELAGRFRRAAMLAFQNIQRWRRTDGDWAGSFFVTKNHFDPALRVGYQQASQYSNYNGSLMFHLAEAWRFANPKIPEQATPSEIGGYAFATGEPFATAFANAGGMLVQANLRGQTSESNGNWWTPAGIVRMGRTGWDTRLGPADGALSANGGVSFGPVFFEDGRWVGIADLADRYSGSFAAKFTHPMLVRCSIEYRPKAGKSGPQFRIDLTLTPDGVLAETSKLSSDHVRWGVSWPILVNDGRRLAVERTPGRVSVGYSDGRDRQNFVTLDAPTAMEEGRTVRGSYGDLQAWIVPASKSVQRTFVYPSTAGDPSAGEVQRSLGLADGGFRSVLGRVEGNVYTGRNAAGGEAASLDIDGDGRPDIRFAERCAFVVQLRRGRPAAVEADRSVSVTVNREKYSLSAFVPRRL